MRKRVSKISLALPHRLNVIPRMNGSNLIRANELGAEKGYILEEEKRRLATLRMQYKGKSLQDEEFLSLSDDLDVEQIIADRESLAAILTEYHAPQTEKLIKKLMAWKHSQ